MGGKRAFLMPIRRAVGRSATTYLSRTCASAVASRQPPADPYSASSRNLCVIGEGYLDSGSLRSLYVLMSVETLSDALAAGWRVHARCVDGVVDNTRSRAKCRHQAELNLETLVWTRGRNMPLAGLRERMMCPRCGNRRVSLIFDPPTAAKTAS